MNLSIGCATARPPVVYPPPAATFPARTMTVRFAGPPTPTVTLTVDTGQIISCQFDAPFQAVCLLDGRVPAPFGGALAFSADGYLSTTVHVLLEAHDWTLPDVVLLDPDAVDLPRIVADGQFLRTADGAPWFGLETSDFALFERWLACGSCIDAVLDQRAHPWGDARWGFNLLRVFTAYEICPTGAGCQPIGRLIPREIEHYEAQLVAFARYVRRPQWRMYLELVALTATWNGEQRTATLPSEDAIVEHWERLIRVQAAAPNVILELVNEHTETSQRGIPYERLRRPDFLASAGSGGADSLPRQPPWSLATYHPGFGSDWMRKAVHNGWEDVAEPWHLPVLVNEMTRFPDNDSNPQHAYDVGRGCMLMVAGCAFHSVHGKAAQLWDALELSLARRFADGAQSLPIACRTGGYRHRTDLESPDVIRAYQRGGGDACIALVHR